MADVLPSCIGMESLLYLLFSGFVQANKSHWTKCFQLVRINPSGGEFGFRTTTQHDFQTPKYTHPFDGKINMAIFAKMTALKSSPSMASTQFNERIRVSAILGGASTGFSLRQKSNLPATFNMINND